MFFIGAAAAWFGTRQSGDRPRNVLLITIDTLRADHMSAYGYARSTTPNLDRFMAGGTRFKNALSTASITAPSHAAIMTGKYPSWTSIQLENGQQFALDENETTLAELCRGKGMYTGAVVSSATLMHKVGLDQGFADYDDRIALRDPAHKIGKQPADFSCAKTLRLLKQHSGKPFFFWLHLMDPHGPYAPPPDWISKMAAQAGAAGSQPARLPIGSDESGYRAIPQYQSYNNDTAFAGYVCRYDAEIAFLDEQLGRLFDTLKKDGVLEDTLVVITADHGEALGEDDFYFAHTQSVGLEQVHVPLAFFGPQVKAGQVIDEPVSNLDILATVCAAMDLKAPDGLPSRNLLAVLQGSAMSVAAPPFCGTISQWGGAKGNQYYRRDRRPESDARFWAWNYNSNAVHKPCGERLVSLSDNKPISLSQGRELKDAVIDFGRRADEASKTTPRVRKVNRDPREKRDLRSTGYFTGGDDSNGAKGTLSSTPASRP